MSEYEELATTGIFDPQTFLLRQLENGLRADMIQFGEGSLAADITNLAVASEGNEESEAYASAMSLVEKSSWKAERKDKWRDYVRRKFAMVRALKDCGVSLPRMGTEDVAMYWQFVHDLERIRLLGLKISTDEGFEVVSDGGTDTTL